MPSYEVWLPNLGSIPTYAGQTTHMTGPLIHRFDPADGTPIANRPTFTNIAHEGRLIPIATATVLAPGGAGVKSLGWTSTANGTLTPTALITGFAMSQPEPNPPRLVRHIPVGAGAAAEIWTYDPTTGRVHRFVASSGARLTDYQFPAGATDLAFVQTT